VFTVRRSTWFIVAGVVVVAALAVVLTVVLTGGNDNPQGSGSTGPRPTGPASSGASRPGSTSAPGGSSGPVTGDVKPLIRGLIDRQGEPNKNMLDVVHAYVVKVNWADLQPEANGPIATDNAIDKAIARVRESDYKQVGMALKLRVFAGVNAPDWVKDLGGTPIQYTNTQEGGSIGGGTIGRFWNTASQQAYAQLQQKLAAKYDTVPEIREITMSGCTTLFDEPFVRQPASGNAQKLAAAGYTEAADKSCIVSAMKAHDVWKHTTTDVDFSPFPDVEGGTDQRDVGYPIQMMNTCRQLLGNRCGLQNNALSTDKLANPDFTEMYQAMSRLGSPLIFQTAARKRIGDPEQTLTAAVHYGANSVELPQGYPRWPMDQLQTAAAGLAQNPVR
jgi:hypothetical protein